MIVQSMTPKEVYRELDADMENITRWWSHKQDELERKALKQTKFPMMTWYEHTTPRKNRYLFLSVVFKRKYRNNSILCTLALQKTSEGTVVHITKLSYQHLPCKMTFLPHAFDRYCQRAAVKKQGIDLIKHFFERNHMGEPTMDERFSGKSVRYKGRDNVCSCFPEGVMLGEYKDDVFVAHTFITYEDATGLQREEFEKKKGMILSPEEISKQAREIYMNNYYNL